MTAKNEVVCLQTWVLERICPCHINQHSSPSLYTFMSSRLLFHSIFPLSYPKRNAIIVYILFILVLDTYDILETNVFVDLGESVSYDLMLGTQELLVESSEVIISKDSIKQTSDLFGVGGLWNKINIACAPILILTARGNHQRRRNKEQKRQVESLASVLPASKALFSLPVPWGYNFRGHFLKMLQLQGVVFAKHMDWDCTEKTRIKSEPGVKSVH